MALFIPDFHFAPAADKLKPEWAMRAINYLYYNTRNIGLLEGKDVREIEEYASGEFDMRPFKRIYKSEQKKLDRQNRGVAGASDRRNLFNYDKDQDMQFLPVAAIPVKLNSATALVQKIPIEVTCTATDPLAAKKKEEDMTFLKNKGAIEQDLQDFADQMNIGKVDLGETKHSSIPFSSNPYGLDLEDPTEGEVFSNLLYSLSVESAFETILQNFYKLKNANQIKLLEIIDQFKFGVSVNRCFESSMTRLPDIEYCYPLNVFTPFSLLPDLSDRTHDFEYKTMTVLEMFNNFSNEIGGKTELDRMINGDDIGYCPCNKLGPVDAKNFDTFKINMIHFECKSIDWIGIGSNPKSKKGFSYLTADPDKAKDKIWAQNTYSFWWLPGTQYIFDQHRLGYASRKEGLESYQGFERNIYRSQKRGAVELCIPENKKIQIASIKLTHALIMSVPDGKYINLKYLRGALDGLKEENNAWTIDDLLALFFERNIMIGDTEGFDAKVDGQLKPFESIPGGLKAELNGYITTIRECAQNISSITGINDQLTGQGVNPEGLVGVQKLLINSSINALHYANEAIQVQYQKVFNQWASLIQAAVAAGGASKKAVENVIGDKKTRLIEGLNQIPLHVFGINVSVNQREEERAKYTEKVARLILQGVITVADEYMLENIPNPKDKIALLAVRERQFYKRKQKETEAQYAQQQQLAQQQGQNMLAVKQQEGQNDKEIVYAKGDVQANITQLASQLGINAAQLDGLIKKSLQDDRNKAQLDKSISTLNQKSQLELQEPLASV